MRGRAGTLDNTVSSIIAPTSGTGLELQVGSAGSVIDGFTFSGGSRGIDSTSGPIDNLQILNNQIVGFSTQAVFLNDPGVDITVHQNVFDGASQSSPTTVFHLDQDGFDGFHFTSNNVLNGDTGFFVDGTHNVGQSSSRDPLFDGNLFQGNAAGANFGRFAVEFATITNNIFNDNSLDGLQGGIQNSLIQANTFSNNNRAGLRLTGFGGTGDSTRGAQGNTITNNVFFGNGSSMDAAGYGDVRLDDQFDGTQSTNAFTNNSFGSTVTVYNNETSGEDIDFSGNWWGSNVEATVANSIQGAGAADVDFTPFLDSGTDLEAGTPGFQGDFSTLHVVSDTFSAQTGATARIQEGVNLVDAGGTVNVGPGAYNEQVAIGSGKPVKLLGAGAGSTTIAPSSGEYAVVLGLVNGTAETLAGTEVSGFTIVAGPDAEDHDGIRLNATGTEADPILIRNNIFTGDIDQSKGIETPAYSGIGYVEITDNDFSTLKYGMFANSLSHSLVARNTVSDIKYSGFAFDTSTAGRLDDITIADNTITGAGATGDSSFPDYRTAIRLSDTVTNVTITGNFLTNSAAYGISLAERNGSVTPSARVTSSSPGTASPVRAPLLSPMRSQALRRWMPPATGGAQRMRTRLTR